MSSLYDIICDIITFCFMVLKCLYKFSCSSYQNQSSPSMITVCVHKTLLDAMSLYDVTYDSRGLLPGFCFNFMQFFWNFRQNIGAPTPTHRTIPDSSMIISEVRRQTVIEEAIYTIKFFCKCILLRLVKQSRIMDTLQRVYISLVTTMTD